MTATELHEALRGVPAEALYAGLDYATYSDTGEPHWRIGFMPTTNQIAAALQRDAMWLWLESQPPPMSIVVRSGWRDRKIECWAVYQCCDWYDEHIFSHATPLHALAAACRYVAEVKP